MNYNDLKKWIFKLDPENAHELVADGFGNTWIVELGSAGEWAVVWRKLDLSATP